MRRKTMTPKPGTFLALPLKEGLFGFGRALEDPYMAFYNWASETSEQDLAELDGRPILFKVAVRLFDSDGWKEIGRQPLSDDLKKPVQMWMEDARSPTGFFVFDSLGYRHPGTKEEVATLERASVWDAHNVVHRLEDTLVSPRSSSDE